jgi:hypothetical protein
MEIPADSLADRPPLGATPARPAPAVMRRFAAAGALIALVLAIVLAVANFLNDPVRLPVALLLILTVVMAGWTALVHRGATRAVATTVAVVALLGLIVLLISGSPLRLAILVGLVLLSMAAARVALGPDMADAPAGVRNVGAADHGSGGPAAGRSTISTWRPRHAAEGSSRSCCNAATTCGRSPSKPWPMAPT